MNYIIRVYEVLDWPCTTTKEAKVRNVLRRLVRQSVKAALSKPRNPIVIEATADSIAKELVP